MHRRAYNCAQCHADSCAFSCTFGDTDVCHDSCSHGTADHGTHGSTDSIEPFDLGHGIRGQQLCCGACVPPL